jgi:hypothetical protein
VPETVVDPEFNDATFAFPATTFPRVVLASVDDPLTDKLFVLVVEAFVVVALSVVMLPVVAKRFVKIAEVILARVAKKFVEVELVIVPFVNETPEIFRFEIFAFCIFAVTIVVEAIVAVASVVVPVADKSIVLVVVELVVEA